MEDSLSSLLIYRRRLGGFYDTVDSAHFQDKDAT